MRKLYKNKKLQFRIFRVFDLSFCCVKCDSNNMKIFKYSKSIQKIFKKYRQNKTLTVSQTINDRNINSVN